MEKSRDIHARLNPTEQRALMHLAALERRTVSAVVRELVRTAAKQHGVWPTPEPMTSERTAQAID